jgi:hypothetical protein
MQLQSIKCEMFRQKSCFKLKPFKDLKVGSERHYLVNGFIPASRYHGHLGEAQDWKNFRGVRPGHARCGHAPVFQVREYQRAWPDEL